jgi:hypothetical protein
MPVTGNSILDERVFASAILFPGDDVIDIDLPAIIYQPWVINSGSGNDFVTLKGGGTLLSANLGDGNDNITLKDFGHVIDMFCLLSVVCHELLTWEGDVLFGKVLPGVLFDDGTEVRLVGLDFFSQVEHLFS